MKKFSILFALLVMLTGTALAQNGSTTVKGEQCGWTYNPCCNEWIELCLTYNLVIDKDGNLKHINASGKGTGVNGTNYVLGQVQNASLNFDGQGADNGTITLSVKYNATGSDCGFTVKYVVHVTINANGEVTSTVENIRIECENGTIL